MWVYLCIFSSHFLYPFVDGHLGCFITWILLIILQWLGLCISLEINDFISVEYIPRIVIAGSCDNSIFSLLGSLHTIFCNGYINLHSQKEKWTRAPFSTHPLQHLLILEVLIIAILTDMGWYLVLNFAFPWWLVMLSSFYIPVSHSHVYVFFGKMSA